MEVFRLLKKHVGAVVVVLLFLVLQANAELALPTYMSEIVDVGIQQKGIESAVPSTVRAQTLAGLEQLMSPVDAALAKSSYGEPNADGIQSYVGSEGDRAKNGALSQAVSGIVAKMAHMDGQSDSIKQQAGIQFVIKEYEAQGVDLGAIQNGYLVGMAAKMFGLCLVDLGCAVVVGLIAARTAAKIARDMRRKTFKKVMQFSPAEVNKFSQASLITRCTNDVQQVQMAITILMRMVVLAPITGIIAFMRVTATSTSMEWLIAVAIVAVASVLVVLVGLAMPRFRKMQQLVDRVNLAAREMLDGIMPIRAFGRQKMELAKFDAASTDLMGTQLFTNRAMAFLMPTMMLIMNAVTIAIVWIGAHNVSEGAMQVGDMMAFISYTMQIIMAFMILSMVSIILPRASVAAKRVREVQDCPLSIVDPAAPKTPAADAPRGELVFDSVGFTYPDADERVVGGVSFVARAGEMTGIIGSTGSGKSTLIKLIPRLYDVTEGSVRLDGVDVRDMTLSDLRSRIGYVPQQGMLFSGTIESNLKFAGEGVSDADMTEAARVAQAQEFIAEKDEGYQSAISQRGSNVSGGQRQRLSIARALAKKPEVLVFDDSFSALDYKTDARLREELAASVKDAALVVVAQRIATIMHANQILVLDEGDVVGQGTHDELLRSCPTYLEIAQSQLSPEELGLTEDEVAAVFAAAGKGGER